MSHNAKILWGEGLFLRPQLFQQQDRYHEARLSQMSQLLQPYAWGIQRLKLDKASLALGTLRVLGFRNRLVCFYPQLHGSTSRCGVCQ
ncbi:hypothetical protein Pfra02_29910 [Pseudomonas fragi]|nr:hypothetical protein Pfra02_29910 [Pseudomonas fragi]